MNVYFERTPDGKFFHGGLAMVSVIRDTPQEGAIESSRRLELAARVNGIEQQMMKQLNDRFTSAICELATINDGDEVTTKMAKMQMMTNLPMLLGLLAGNALMPAHLSTIGLNELEAQSPL